MDNEYEEKRKIIEDLILKEEDIKVQLKRLVKLAKPFLSIEGKSGRVILKNLAISNPEKIVIFLLGKYFAFQTGMFSESSVKLGDIGEGLGIVVTTLSAPIARLVNDNIVDKPQKDSYQINPYCCEKFLEEMNQKYSHKVDPKSTEGTLENGGDLNE